jgi:hypothetical protein
LFRNIATENELRKIYARLMKKGFAEGFLLPSLKEVCVSHPCAGEMRRRAEAAGWKSRDIAVAVLAGMIISRKKVALASGDTTESERMDKYGWDLFIMVGENNWYTASCTTQIKHWTRELVNS